SVKRRVFIAHRIQIFGWHLSFAENWQHVCPEMPVPTLPVGEIIEDPHRMEQLRKSPSMSKPLDPEALEFFFSLSEANKPNLFLWLYIRQEDELDIQAFFCGVDEQGQPNRPDNFARFTHGDDYMGGIMPMDTFLALLKKAPPKSLVVTFFSHGWRIWNDLTKNAVFDAFSFSGCAENELSAKSIQGLLAFPGLGENPVWYGYDFGQEVWVVFFRSEKNPAVFAVQRLASKTGRATFFELIAPLGLKQASATARVHRQLLAVTAFPLVEEFLA